MTDAIVRPIVDADLGRILEINEANVPAVGSLSLSRLAFIVDECLISLAVEVDGEIVGFCLVLGPVSKYESVNYQWFIERYDDFVYLDRVAFDDAFHGRGLGTRVYAEVGKILATTHGDAPVALEINVDPPNKQSLAFHARRGFIEVGQQDTPYGIRVSMQLRVSGDPG